MVTLSLVSSRVCSALVQNPLFHSFPVFARLFRWIVLETSGSVLLIAWPLFLLPLFRYDWWSRREFKASGWQTLQAPWNTIPVGQESLTGLDGSLMMGLVFGYS